MTFIIKHSYSIDIYCFTTLTYDFNLCFEKKSYKIDITYVYNITKYYLFCDYHYRTISLCDV